MNNHPEQRPDEDYLGSTKSDGNIPSHLLNLDTARVGNVAYDVYGEKIPNNRRRSLRPLFIGKIDAKRYHDIMMTRKQKILRAI